ELSERIGLSGSDLEEIRSWIGKLGVHWGVNGADHEAHCGVNFEEFSWEPALDRLLLGYAVAEQDAFQTEVPVIPFDSAEGKDSVKIGNFIRFLQMLFQWRAPLTTEHSLAEWCDILEDMIDRLFCFGIRNYQEIAALKTTFSQFRKWAWNDDKTGRFDLSVISYLIEKKLVPTGISEPFLRGKITFCSLTPMRSIPMDVIAILGLDEQNFPRRDYSPGFNVISSAGQRAALERSRNGEDRYIFLEALLAARKHLLLFYQGRDKKNNQKRPPAVPLAELTDALDSTFPQCAGKWETEHCLQAFDSRYYTKGSGLFSYSEENYRGAEAFSEFKTAAALSELPDGREAAYRLNYPCRIANWEAGSEPETLNQASPKTLEIFYRNPCRFFLETAAGIRKHYDAETVLEDSESPSLNELERYQLRSLILAQIQAGLEPGPQQYRLLKMTNRLPVGEVGKQEYESELNKIRLIPKSWLDRYMNSCGFHVTLELDGFRIEGEIPVHPEDREPYVISRSYSIAKDLIALRLRHLILCAADHCVTAHFWNQKEKCCQHLDGIDADVAREKLHILIQYYQEGHHRPLPFFPNASFSVTPEKQNWRQVAQYRNDFKGNGRFSGDYEDPAVRLIFTEDALDEGSPFLEEFGEIAAQVFGFAKGSGKKKELKKDE
ncbi:MAG: exodeoxyribonuclease V subunit gamma, partial [Lentisphaeria bacterium]|nr:exodeoxyribonuclease V subunit gamma [Lentisphaeria bacterium]